jgi:hypothetical protein
LENAVSKYQTHVELAATYLEARGLWHDETVARYRLGVVAGDVPPEHQTYNGRLVIPYITPTGIVNIKFRCIRHEDCSAEKCPKYLGLPMPDRLYNVQALHDAKDTIYLAEGEIDAISATVAGYPCVGISGARKWVPHYPRLFEDFAEAVAFCEGDDAGREFGIRVRDELESVRVVQLPEGEDVNSFLSSRPYKEFEALLN